MEVLYVRYRILISDDEVDIVEMLTGFFRSKGYEVFSAYNGVETLKLAELQPDIILLDINMPKLDGMEVCKKIRDYVSCPILFLTARIEENDKVQGFSVGGDDYIVKPFSLVELEARVQAHLRREERHQTNTNDGFYLSVSDNGCGFSKNILSKATNPYFTEEENHSEHFGLGLYICKILCEHHGGYLKIENCSIGAKVTAFFKSLD